MAADLDLTTVDRLLTTTRSVRKRLDLTKPVARETILECMHLAIQAPTGGNRQGWRWVVVTEPEKRAAIAKLYKDVMDPYHAANEAVMGERAGGDSVLSSSRYLAEILGDVPVLIIPCILNRLEDARAGLQMLLGDSFSASDNLAASGLYGSIWPAVWSLMLALRSRGLGSALTTMHLANEREVGELLEIPETVTQVGLIPVAYYTGETFKQAARRPAEEITYWDTWKRTS